MVALLRLTAGFKKGGVRSRSKCCDPNRPQSSRPARDEALRRGVLKAIPSLEIKDDSPRRTNLTTANCRQRRTIMSPSPFLGELLGTMFLILFGDGVVAGVLLNKSKAQN